MQKITVALAPDVVRRARKVVKQGRAESLSALVNGVLDERLRRDELDEVLAENDGGELGTCNTATPELEQKMAAFKLSRKMPPDRPPRSVSCVRVPVPSC